MRGTQSQAYTVKTVESIGNNRVKVCLSERGESAYWPNHTLYCDVDSAPKVGDTVWMSLAWGYDV
jgi:hypothetical protein